MLPLYPIHGLREGTFLHLWGLVQTFRILFLGWSFSIAEQLRVCDAVIFKEISLFTTELGARRPKNPLILHYHML